jgi:hypothetical protein
MPGRLPCCQVKKRERNIPTKSHNLGSLLKGPASHVSKTRTINPKNPSKTPQPNQKPAILDKCIKEIPHHLVFFNHKSPAIHQVA